MDHWRIACWLHAVHEKPELGLANYNATEFVAEKLASLRPRKSKQK